MASPSNGTMGHLWMEEWCFRCAHDHSFSHVFENDAVPEKGCDIVARMVIDEETPEIVEENDGGPWDARKMVCRMFEHCRKCRPGGDEPGGPPPVHPDQGVLFDVVDESPGIPAQVLMPMPERVEAGVRL